VDIWDSAKRSRVMASIRSRGNATTELSMARAFRRNEVKGWRRHRPIRIDQRTVRPDFVFPGSHLIVFVDGCFWHLCPLHSKLPASRRRYWATKLAANKARDRRDDRSLRRHGWRVLRIWEHSVRKNPDAVALKVLKAAGKSRRPSR
jgi:DNA mismatch endonuclease (patch repair protein)